MLDIKTFITIFNQIPRDAEFEFHFVCIEDSYMVSKYNDHVEICRCGYENDIPIYKYPTIEELIEHAKIGGKTLKEMWLDIEDIHFDDTLSFKYELDCILSDFNIRL